MLRSAENANTDLPLREKELPPPLYGFNIEPFMGSKYAQSGSVQANFGKGR
jgi:hypothetical protein